MRMNFGEIVTRYRVVFLKVINLKCIQNGRLIYRLSNTFAFTYGILFASSRARTLNRRRTITHYGQLNASLTHSPTHTQAFMMQNIGWNKYAAQTDNFRLQCMHMQEFKCVILRSQLICCKHEQWTLNTTYYYYYDCVPMVPMLGRMKRTHGESRGIHLFIYFITYIGNTHTAHRCAHLHRAQTFLSPYAIRWMSEWSACKRFNIL